MGNLADLIEQYLLQLLTQNDHIELQRRELARMFRCVPSQINYVLETRFTVGRGYLIESRRGGGGFIRIHRVRYAQPVESSVPESISQDDLENLIQEFQDKGWIHEEQAIMAKYVIERNLYGVPTGVRDVIRARLLQAVFMMLSGQG